MMETKYRVDVNYLSRDYDTRALEISSPFCTLEAAFREYFSAIDGEKCVDDKEKPVRAHLWEYHYKKDGTFAPITIAKNY